MICDLLTDVTLGQDQGSGLETAYPLFVPASNINQLNYSVTMMRLSTTFLLIFLPTVLACGGFFCQLNAPVIQSGEAIVFGVEGILTLAVCK